MSVWTLLNLKKKYISKDVCLHGRNKFTFQQDPCESASWSMSKQALKSLYRLVAPETTTWSNLFTAHSSSLAYCSLIFMF